MVSFFPRSKHPNAPKPCIYQGGGGGGNRTRDSMWNFEGVKRRVQRSTKEKARKAAQSRADDWEKLAKERAKARQAHKVIADIYRAAHAKDLPDSTTRMFVDGWLARRQHEIAPASYAAYRGRALHFVEWLGEIADRPITEVETHHFLGYRDSLASTRTASTAYHGAKVLRVIFEDARRDGYVAENPAKDCGLLKKVASTGRRPFTVDELSRILKAADSEWQSLILFGLYTGQRLGDIARLKWSNVDLVAGEIAMTTRKTGRVVRIPICAPFRPRAIAFADANGSTLSRQFGDILANIGLAEKRSHDAEKSGRGARRAKSELSFHCLRHTATSLMKNAGVSPAIVQDIIGHESAEISAHYTHVESAAKREALAVLPDLR